MVLPKDSTKLTLNGSFNGYDTHKDVIVFSYRYIKSRYSHGLIGNIKKINDHFISLSQQQGYNLTEQAVIIDINHDLASAARKLYGGMKRYAKFFADELNIEYNEDIDNKLREILEGENET